MGPQTAHPDILRARQLASQRPLASLPLSVVALCSTVLLSLPATASGTSSSGSPTRSSRGSATEFAFCGPLSPRCFSRKRVMPGQNYMTIAENSAAEASIVSRGPSLDSPDSVDVGGISTPRKHLGPTAEEIVALRRQEALEKKSEVFNNWRYSISLVPQSCTGYLAPLQCDVSDSACANDAGLFSRRRKMRSRPTPSLCHLE